MSGDQDLFDFDDGSSRSARKSGASSSRRRGNKPPKALDDDLDLDQLVGAQSSNFDSINVSNSMSRPPQPQPRRNSKTKDSVDDVNVFGANEAAKGSKSNASKAINSWGDDRPAVTTRHRSPKFGLNDLRHIHFNTYISFLYYKVYIMLISLKCYYLGCGHFGNLYRNMYL